MGETTEAYCYDLKPVKPAKAQGTKLSQNRVCTLGMEESQGLQAAVTNLSIDETRAANLRACIRRHPTQHTHALTQRPTLSTISCPLTLCCPRWSSRGMTSCCKDGPAVEPRWGSGRALSAGHVREQPKPALRRPGCREALFRVRGQGGGDAPRGEAGRKVYLSMVAKERGKGAWGERGVRPGKVKD